jgi:perosamine synthetase
MTARPANGMIAVNEPLLDGRELEYLTECIKTGWISSEGPFVDRLEREFAAVSGRGHGIAVCNGTAALQVAIEALDLPAGSEVILPSMTIMSCAFPLMRLGLKPVLIDCDPLTYNSTVEQYAQAVTDKTSAIMLVHIYGLPVDLDAILALAKARGLKVIEDAAEVIGQHYKGRPCGSFGDVSTVSFYPNKHITTGEGGMILADAPEIAQRCRHLRNLAFDPSRRFRHHELGWNYRMTNLQAAVGCAQLERLDRNVKLKREIGRAYDKALAKAPHVTLPVPVTNYADNIYWVYSLVLDDKTAVDAAHVMKLLAAEGVGTRPFFYPIHQQPVLQSQYPELAQQKLPVSERLARQGFYIPSGLGLTPAQIQTVADRVIFVLERL